MAEPCIESNADIAGVGVRVAVYLQAFLGFAPLIPPIIFPKQAAKKSSEKSYQGILITASALLINAFIQIHDLSAYHTLLILDLSWINILATFVWLFNSFASTPRPHHDITTLCREFTKPFQSWLGSVYACLVGVLGLRFWAKIHVSGNQQDCTLNTVTSVFSRRISLKNKGLRYGSMVFYGIATVPIINILVPFLLLNGLANIVVFLTLLLEARPVFRAFQDVNRVLYVAVLLLGVMLDALLVVDIQLIIRWNNGLLKDKNEADWGFGQTLALLMVILPVLDTFGLMSTFGRNTGKTTKCPTCGSGPSAELNVHPNNNHQCAGEI